MHDLVFREYYNLLVISYPIFNYLNNAYRWKKNISTGNTEKLYHGTLADLNTIGEGAQRIYVVEYTGPIEDDLNRTGKNPRVTLQNPTVWNLRYPQTEK